MCSEQVRGSETSLCYIHLETRIMIRAVVGVSADDDSELRVRG